MLLRSILFTGSYLCLSQLVLAEDLHTRVPHIVEEGEYVPAPNSKSTPGGVHFRRYDDGTVETFGGGPSEPGVDSGGIIIDNRTRTYRVEPPEDTERHFEMLNKLPKQGGHHYNGPVPPRPDVAPRLPHYTPSVYRVPASEEFLLRYVDNAIYGRWKEKSSITESDFAGLHDAFYTVNVIKWNTDGFGGFSFLSYDDFPLSAPLNPSGDLWYVGNIQDGGLWWRWTNYDGWQLCHDAVYQYYNYNFPESLLPRYNNPTFVTHRTELCATDHKGADHYYWHWETGPHAELLHTSFRFKTTAR